MAKRKRGDVANDVPAPGSTTSEKPKASELQESKKSASQPVTVQIVTGSYDRILHGITATISSAGKVEFADTFLFNAHTSAIRCLALSPPSAPEPGRAQKVMLASGSNDERINVYNISAHPPKRESDPEEDPEEDLDLDHQETQNKKKKKKEEEGGSESNKKEKSSSRNSSMNEMLSTIAPRRILENPRNREVGTLLHHAASVTRLSFPTRAKLLSASEDASVGVTRTRDWALLSAIKTPIPKPAGRPSGDTAALGAAPHGVADFAVHPSMKLMLTVGRGERCMRLWNLMTARKAGVLNFGRDVLVQAGEGKHALGEGRRVVWGVSGEDEGDEFCVAFDRDLLVYGMDSTPKCRVMPDHRTKVHEVCYVVTDQETDAALLAVSTEDGRVMFFSTRSEDLTAVPKASSSSSSSSKDAGKKAEEEESSSPLPVAKLVAEIGGHEAGVTGRIKDFSVLRASQGGGEGDQLIIPTGSSDGKVRIFTLSIDELNKARKGKEAATKQQVGRLLGTYETSNRITCLEAFVMIPRPEGAEDSEEEEEEFEGLSEGGDEDEDEEEDEEDSEEEE